jgi:hypothetical protein
MALIGGLADVGRSSEDLSTDKLRAAMSAR